MNFRLLFRLANFLIAALLITACGGSTEDVGQQPVLGPSPPLPASPPPSALGARPTLATFVLPGSGTAAISLERKYSNLNFSRALLATVVPTTNRLVVAQQSGLLTSFVDHPDTATSDVVLDLQTQVRDDGEQGLLGIAFDPAFASNKHLFLHYTPADEPRRSRIARFTWPDPTNNGPVDPATELVIIEVQQPFSNHNGGSIEFGPDGMLYIALGDGGAAGDPLNNAQNPENLLGSILRIDVRGATAAAPYAIPDDNPWANSTPQRGELWAIGLRNPFRVSFDRANGELWAGDVGQSTREEINLIEGGGNYGWRVREGRLPFDDSANSLPLSAFVEPIFDLPREQARSITGGDVYRGSQFPGLNGSYIYGDFATENIWSLRRIPDAEAENTLIGSVPLPAHFGRDGNGELLITSYTSGFYGLSSGTGNTPEPAAKLSETGLFTNLQDLTVASGLIEYSVTEPHWSDGAEQRRWLAVPREESIRFANDAPWELPEGSVLLKQLDMPTADQGRVRLETRLFIRSAQGWQPFTYVWDSDQADAQLTTSGTNIELSVQNPDGAASILNYRVPSQGECLSCHTAAAGVTLSTNTRQFNRDFDYAGTNQNQLLALNGINMFDANILAATSPTDYPAHTASQDVEDSALDLAARSYLDVNCSNCHRPNGPTGSTLDLRSGQAIADLNALAVTPLAGDLGLSNPQIIAPGAPERSVLLERMKRLGSDRMPPVANNRIDSQGVAVIERWINGL